MPWLVCLSIYWSVIIAGICYIDNAKNYRTNIKIFPRKATRSFIPNAVNPSQLDVL